MICKKVVVIGGGSGTYTLLEGLKRQCGTCEIIKVVSMADSGGSTGRLRDEFGQLPVGDVRMGLAALAAEDTKHEQLLRELLLYRFANGEGLKGHNFGNLLLVALTDLVGSEAEAIRTVSRLFRIRGQVLPVTEDHVHLKATYEDGTVVLGEHDIDEPPADRVNQRIVAFACEPSGHMTTEVGEAIKGADLIVLGPGDLYTSLLANCVIDGVAEAIKAAPGTFVYISNLMTRPGQTRGMKLSDYITELERYVGRTPDAIMCNTTALPAEALERYRSEGDEPVENDLDVARVITGDYLSRTLVTTKAGDVLQRSLIRHDGDKLASAILQLP